VRVDKHQSGTYCRRILQLLIISQLRLIFVRWLRFGLVSVLIHTSFQIILAKFQFAISCLRRNNHRVPTFLIPVHLPRPISFACYSSLFDRRTVTCERTLHKGSKERKLCQRPTCHPRTNTQQNQATYSPPIWLCLHKCDGSTFVSSDVEAQSSARR
jgi:hypothetical protein